jgi:group I intron endonuclease
MGIVYVLENKINGKCYVGQTIMSMKERLHAHRYGGTAIFSQALKKYGINAFKIIENEVPEKYMDSMERGLIKLYGSIAPNGYNLESGGHACKHHHPYTLAKLSEIRSGEKNWAYGKPGTMLGKHHSDEAKKKMSKDRLGKPKSKEHRESISRSRMGKPSPTLGKHFSDESRERMSKAKSLWWKKKKDGLI